MTDIRLSPKVSTSMPCCPKEAPSLGWQQEEEAQHGGSQGLLGLPHRQGVQGGGGAQTRCKEKGMGEEGEEGLLADICEPIRQEKGEICCIKRINVINLQIQMDRYFVFAMVQGIYCLNIL